MLLPAVLLEAFENGFNRLLSLDPDVGSNLKPLLGKVIAIKIKPFDWTLYCFPHHGGIQLLERFDGEPDTVIIGTAPALLSIALSDSPLSILTRQDVVIEGDTDVGRGFQAFFEHLDFDPEEHVSHYTGDVIAHRIGQVVRSRRSWTQSIVKKLELDIKEFLQYETRDLPAQTETNHFFEDVDTLRSDEDRLEARIQRLQAALSHH